MKLLLVPIVVLSLLTSNGSALRCYRMDEVQGSETTTKGMVTNCASEENACCKITKPLDESQLIEKRCCDSTVYCTVMSKHYQAMALTAQCDECTGDLCNGATIVRLVGRFSLLSTALALFLYV